MIDEIQLTELFNKRKNKNHTLVDVRSPKEFNEATIPGSINIPIFTTEERAEIGKLYKQTSQEAAKNRGLEIFSQKLPTFINEFKKINTPITVFCWRGGMRSKAVATVLELMDIHVTRLHGGFRTYRQWVMDELNKETFKPNLLVLNGHTGSGKTIILDKLAEKGYPVIDLEKIANHRGSIFGQIGLNPNKQKHFESLLVETMKDYAEEPFVFIEGESKRIGKVVLPDFFYYKKEISTQIFIELPFKKRVDIILDEYHPTDNPKLFLDAFNIIKKHIHTPIATKIENSLQNLDFRTAIKLLLEYYYDPRYNFHGKEYDQQQIIYVDSTTIDYAINQIEEIVINNDLCNKK